MDKKRKKALIIDDDSDIIDLVSIYLEDEFEVTPAFGAEDAFTELKKQTFDVIIVDIYLPEVDGKEIIQKIREHDTTPILAISGYLQRETFVKEVKGLGANDFLEKPFMLGTFLNTIAKLV